MPTKKKKTLKHFRPEKPYPEFPLTPVAGGQWAKRIRGQLHYFGRWCQTVKGKQVRLPKDGWEDALALYKAQCDDLYAGRTPNMIPNQMRLKDLCNDFLTYKLQLVESGEIKSLTFNEYRQACERLIRMMGGNTVVDQLRPEDFIALRAKLAKDLGPAGLSGQVGRIKAVFAHSRKQELIPREFKKASASVMRKIKNAKGPNLFTRDEMHWILNGKTDEDGKFIPGATGQLRAMTLLGINCGLGCTDCALLPLHALDLEKGVLNFPRPKTGIPRTCPLWPETVKSLQEVIAARPTPATKADADLVFLTRFKSRWVRDVEHWGKDEDGNRTLKKVTSINTVSGLYGKLLKALHINGRKGIGYYTLRHTFASIGLQVGDRDSVKSLMGHSFTDILAGYDETGPSMERRLAVVNHIHGWLFGKAGEK